MPMDQLALKTMVEAFLWILIYKKAEQLLKL